MSAKASPSTRRTLRLRLFVAGQAPNSVAAIRHLRTLLAEYRSVKADIEIVDLLQYPERGMRDGVLVTPTMIRLSPAPERRMIGNLTDIDSVLSVLDLTDLDRD
jgi:circadian clock protein KaiB